MIEFLTKKQKEDLKELTSHLLKQTKTDRIKWTEIDDHFVSDFNGIRFRLYYNRGQTKRSIMDINRMEIFNEEWTIFPSKIAKNIKQICEILIDRRVNNYKTEKLKKAQKCIDEAKEVYLIEKLSGIDG